MLSFHGQKSRPGAATAETQLHSKAKIDFDSIQIISWNARAGLKSAKAGFYSLENRMYFTEGGLQYPWKKNTFLSLTSIAAYNQRETYGTKVCIIAGTIISKAEAMEEGRTTTFSLETSRVPLEITVDLNFLLPSSDSSDIHNLDTTAPREYFLLIYKAF